LIVYQKAAGRAGELETHRIASWSRAMRRPTARWILQWPGTRYTSSSTTARPAPRRSIDPVRNLRRRNLAHTYSMYGNIVWCCCAFESASVRAGQNPQSQVAAQRLLLLLLLPQSVLPRLCLI
jgi:hypothetical protein